MDKVFDALADESRRKLLDALYAESGLRLTELCSVLAMSRQAASKHLLILEEAELVVTAWRGREKLHYLNPVPLREIYARWIRKFDDERIDALRELKGALENES